MIFCYHLFGVLKKVTSMCPMIKSYCCIITNYPFFPYFYYESGLLLNVTTFWTCFFVGNNKIYIRFSLHLIC